MQPLLIPTDTQAAMLDALNRWLTEAWPFERRQAALATPEGVLPLWQGLADELGLLGAAVPDSAGGLGGGAADQLLLMQALGRALAGEPYLGTAVVGAGLLQRCGQGWAADLLPALVAGHLRVALAAAEPGMRHHWQRVASRVSVQADGRWRLDGRKTLVIGAPTATHFVATARDADGRFHLLWVQAGADGVRRRDLRTVDGPWAAELAFDGVTGPPEAVLASGAAAEELLARAIDEATLAAGAEAIGVMDRLMRDTVDYLNQRRQFGVPIASFQALQHRLADMHLAMVQARALVAATLPALEAPAAERAAAVSSAHVAVARACRAVGQGAVQLHGGMGMTDELWIGHGVKRLVMIEQQFGTVEAHLDRVARHQALPA